METFQCETINGKETVVVYNVHDYPFYKITGKLVYKKGKNPKWYINAPAAFDIETTALKKLKLIPAADGTYKTDGTYKCESFMYHWQLCINDKVVFGRTWKEFVYFIKRLRKELNLSDTKILPIYVHYLAYEFQFMKDFFQWESVFAKEPHKVMKASIYGIEFRCSYYLSNMSLAKFCENSEGVRFYKMVDKFDYSKIRTPSTKLTDTEKGYCYCDVRGLCECIESLMKEDTLATIPLTNTGYVRREYRHAMKTKENRANFHKLALTKEQYYLCKKAFRGGNTHANRKHANREIWNVHSFDLSSSYPAAIMLDYFPMGKFSYITLDSQEKLDHYLNNYCVILTVCFYDIKVKDNIAVPYIDIAHCEERSKIKNDNGRVLKADYLKITLTEIDLEIIRNTYDYKGFQVEVAMAAKRGKLPKELRQKCMEFFVKKSTLKGVDGKEYEYMKSKNRLNSTYGMMVTALINNEIVYDGVQWVKLDPDEDALEKYYNNKNSFLHYQWGVYVTAQARKRLQHMLDIVGMDVVYIDTDSIKFIGIEHVREFEKCNEETLKLILESDIPPIVEIDNKTYTMGTWDNDGNYIVFKTLGAKKYCDIKEKDGLAVFETTVSGMSKKLGAENIKCPRNFKINRTMENIGRTISWYNESPIHNIMVNGEEIETASNIGVLDTTYTLGITGEYHEILAEFENIA